MKILHAITSLDKGGAENHLAILSKEQSKNKNKVMIFISKNSFYWLDFLKKNKVKVHKSNFFKEYNWIYKIVKLYKDIFCLVQIINKQRPDVIHAHLPYMELVSYFCIIFTKHKPKFIISKHVDNVFFKGSEGQNRSIIGSLIAKVISLKAHKIIAISRAVKFFLCSDYVGIKKNKIKVVYYGLKTLKILTNKNGKKLILNKKNDLILGCMARLVPQKSIENILESISILKKEDLKLVIVGKGPMKFKLKLLVRKLNIEKKIIWVDFIDDLQSFYKKIDIFVLTSKYEGLGLVFLEAMFSKKPIIASNTSAMPEIIKNNHNGFLVKPDNPIILSKSILSLKSKKLRLKFGNNGFKILKKNFTVEKMYKETQNIYLK